MAMAERYEIRRTLIIRFTSGDSVRTELLAAASTEGIGRGLVHLTGTLTSGRLILGHRKYSRATVDPDRASFEEPFQVVGLGELGTGPAGAEIAIRCSLGREREVFVASLVEGTAGDDLVATVMELAPNPPP